MQTSHKPRLALPLFHCIACWESCMQVICYTCISTVMPWIVTAWTFPMFSPPINKMDEAQEDLDTDHLAITEELECTPTSSSSLLLLELLNSLKVKPQQFCRKHIGMNRRIIIIKKKHEDWGVKSSIALLQLQGLQFHPELALLFWWSLTCFL